jgi:hypothetical protein
MKIISCIAVLVFCLWATPTFASVATDTTHLVVSVNPQVKLINNDTPTILRKGEILTVKVQETEKHKTTVRIHSSLGKLVKEFMGVENQISMSTDRLLPGVYLVIIKQADKREVRKFLLTE